MTLSGQLVAASTIINRAWRIVTQNGGGTTPDVYETADALEAYNSMLDSWRNEELMCYANQDESFTFVANQPSYTIGLGGDFNTNRPVRIDGAYVVYQNISYPVEVFTDLQYASIPYKPQTSQFPTVIYYSPELPLGRIFPYPIPDNATADLHLITWVPFLAFATAATTAYLAPGWVEASVWNLAIKMAPEYQFPVTQDMKEAAKEAKGNIKRANNKTPVTTFDNTLLGNSFWDWRSGTYM